MSRIIKDRNNRSDVKWHHPIGVSATKRGASLTIAETLKKTSIIERQKMMDESPLFDEFKAGTPIESLDLLEYIDLGVQPLDLTDADELSRIAKAQVEAQFAEYEKRQKEAALRAGAGGVAAASGTDAPASQASGPVVL